MELSSLVAKIVSLTYLAVALGAFFATVRYDKVLDEFDKSPALTYMTGFVSLVLGMLIVHYHNFWVRDWTLLITLVGWCALVKGIILISFPGFLPSFKPLFKHTRYFGIVTLIIGLFFGYLGFII